MVSNSNVGVLQVLYTLGPVKIGLTELCNNLVLMHGYLRQWNITVIESVWATISA